MSRDWVVDRLGRMQNGSTAARAVSHAIRANVGLTRSVPTGWAGFAGASKTYYSANHNPPAINAATMHGVVIAARWNGVQLGYVAQAPVRYF